VVPVICRLAESGKIQAAGNFVTAYWLPEEQQLIDIMKNNWSG